MKAESTVKQISFEVLATSLIQVIILRILCVENLVAAKLCTPRANFGCAGRCDGIEAQLGARE
jgi:hypothetical protein